MHRNPIPLASSVRPAALRRRAPLYILIAGLCVLGGGCQTKAPPTRAEIQQQALASLKLPDTWKAGRTIGPITDNWIATFDDAQLDALVNEAIERNPDLRVAASTVEQAAQYVELASLTCVPTINIFGSGGVKEGGEDALQVLSLGISWELDLWGRLRYARNAAQEDYASAQADFEFARQSIASTTAKSWFIASETLLQQQIANDMAASAQQLLTLAEKRQQVGAGNEQDVALARANLGTYQDSAKQIRLAHEQALRALGAAARSLSGDGTEGTPGPYQAARPRAGRHAAGNARAPAGYDRSGTPRGGGLQSGRRVESGPVAPGEPQRQHQGSRHRNPDFRRRLHQSDRRIRRKTARTHLPGRRAQDRRGNQDPATEASRRRLRPYGLARHR